MNFTIPILYSSGRLNCYGRGVFLLLGLSLVTTNLSAATLSFNSGSTWDTITLNWLNVAAPSVWLNTGTDVANFSGVGTSVSIQGGVTAGSVNFTTSGYTLTGGSLTLAGSATSNLSVGNGMTASVSAAVLNGFTKIDTGTLILANAAAANTGNVVVGAGTLKYGAANQIADTASLTVLSGAVLDMNSFSDTFTMGNDSSATGTITNSTFAALSTLTIGTTGTPGTFYGNFTGNLGFTDSNAGNLTFAGTTASTNTGNATFNAATANTITFNKTPGANVFGGNVIITRGTVVLQQSEQISNGGTVTIDLANSAQLNLNNQSETIGGLVSANAGISTAVNLGSGTLTFGGNNSSAVFNGVIIGTGSLVKMGSSTSTLAGANSFSGGLVINAGAIAVATDAPLGGTSGGVTLNGGTLQTTGSFTTGRAFAFGTSGGTFSVDPSTTFTLNSSASISGTSAMAKIGLGSLALQSTSGNPLGTGQFTLTTGAIQFTPSGSGADIAISSVNTAAGTRFFFAQGNTLALNKGSNNSLTLTLGNAAAVTPASAANGVLARSGQGTLVIAPTALANLGSTEKLLINGGVFQVNNIVNSTVVAQEANAQKPADFLTYSGTNGLQVATYTDANFTAPTAASIENITVNSTLSANQQVYALRIGDGTAARSLNLNGNTLTLGNGVSSNAAGLILNAGASGNAVSLTGGTLAFGNSEGSIYVGAGVAGSSISSVITGSRGLTFFGPGVTTLSGANIYTGTTTVNSGTLRLGTNNALPSSTTLNLQTSLITGFDLNNFNQTLAALTGSSNISLGSGILTVGDATSPSYGGIISGTGSLIKQGSGSFTLLTNSSTYTGGTTINEGSIKLNGSNRLPTTGALLIASGASLDLVGNNSQTVTTLTGLGSVINTGGVTSTPTLTFGSAGNFTTDTTLGTGTSNIFNIAKAGTGTTTLTANNTYTGSTLVSGGVLKVGSATAIPGSTLLTVGATGGSTAATFDLNGNSVSVSGLAAGTTSGAKTINSSVTGAILTVNNSAASSYSGLIQNGAGDLALIKQNSGVLTLSGANTYTGSTVLTAGTLSVGTVGNGGVASGNLGSAGNAASNLIFDGGTLRYTGATSASDRNFTITDGKTAFLDISTTATNWTLSGSSNSSTGALAKIGTGTLTLSGSNTYTGGTTLTAGTLALGSLEALGNTGSVSFAGGTLQYSTVNTTDYSDRFSMAANQSYRLDTNSQNVTLATALTSNGGTLVKLGSGTLTLTGNNTYTGLTDVQAGTLSLGRSGGTLANAAAVQVSGGTLDVTNSDTVGSVTLSSGTISGAGTLTGSSFNLTNSGILSSNLAGTGGLNKSGAGTVTVSGANTNTGATSVNAGILSVGSIGNGGASSSNLGSATGIAANLVLNGGTLLYTGIGESTNRNFTLGTNGASLDASGSGAISFSGTPTLSGSNTTRTLNLTGTNQGGNTLGGVLGDNGSGSTLLSKTGTGTWVLSRANTFSGGSTITGGVLSVATLGNGGATSSNLGSATNAAGNLVLNGGTLQYTGAGESTDRNFTVGTSGGGLDASGSAAVTFSGTPFLSGSNTARTLTLGGSNLNNNNLGGIVANNGSGLTSLTKSGNGLWILTGANTFSGITTINGGILSVATLGDGGSISGNLGSASNAFTNIVLNGGTLRYTGAGESTDRNFTVGLNGGTLDASGSGAITFSGSPTLNPTNLPRNLTFAGSNTGANIFSGVIGDTGSGATSMTKNGAGAWLFSNSNTYTGVTTLVAGILNADTLANIGTSSSIGRGLSASNTTNAGSLVFDGGTLKYVGLAVTSNRLFTLSQNGGTIDASGIANAALNLNGTGGVLSTGSGDRLLTLTGSSTGANNLAAFLSDGPGGATSLVKAGAGNWGLSAVNAYTGNTTVNAGTLSLSSAGSISNSAILIVGSAGSSGAILDVTAKTSFAVASGQTLKGIGTVNLGAGKTVTINGKLAPGNSIGSDAITGNLTLAGSADFELGSTGTRVSPGLSDRTVVSGGVILGGTLNLINNNGADGNGNAGAGSYLLFTQTGTAVGSFATVNNLLGYRAKVDSSTTGSVFLDNYQLAAATATQTVNVGATRSGTAKSVALTLANISPNNPTYTETLASGAFTAITSGFTATGSVSGIAGGSVGSGTLSVGLGSVLIAGAQSGTATLALNSNAVNGSGLGSAAAGSQTITIQGTVYDYASPTLNTSGPISFGNIHVASGSTSANISITNTTLSNAAFQDSLNASATTNNSGVTGAGFSALAAGGSNQMIVSADKSTVGSLSSSITLNYVSNANGITGLSNTALASGSISTTGYVYSGLGIYNTNGDGSWSDTNKWTANGGSPGLDAGFTHSDTATFGSAATSANPTIHLDGASPSLKSLTFDNSTQSYSLAQGSGGSLILESAAGPATINDNNGSHRIAAPTVLHSNVDVAVTHSSDILTVSGVVSGNQSLTKSGSGTLNLTGSNLYTGLTSVSAGKLLVNGSLSGAASVSSGATLGGVGTIQGAVTAESGSTLSPGNSPGILNTGDLNLKSGSTYLAELNGSGNVAGTDYDQTNVTGSVTLGNSLLNLSLASFNGVDGQTYFIIRNDGTDNINGTFFNLLPDVAFVQGGLTFNISYTADSGSNSFSGGNDVALRYVAAVPEPSVPSLMASGLIALFFLRRKRKE